MIDRTRPWPLPVLVLLVSAGCGSPDSPARAESDATAGETAGAGGAEEAVADAPDPFEAYLEADIPVADGFDYPVGDPDARGSYTDPAGKTHHGWYVASEFCERNTLGLHPGEDWNGRGGGDTDLGQPVYAAGAGKVVFAGDAFAPWGGVVVLEHLFYDNHHRRRVQTVYVHLDHVDVKYGDEVARRQQVGTMGKDPDGLFLAHLHFEIRTDTGLDPTYWPSSEGKDEAWIRQHYEDPSEFIDAHRQLAVPAREPVLLLIDHDSRRMRLYREGAQAGEYEVAFPLTNSTDTFHRRAEQARTVVPDGESRVRGSPPPRCPRGWRAWRPGPKPSWRRR